MSKRGIAYERIIFTRFYLLPSVEAFIFVTDGIAFSLSPYGYGTIAATVATTAPTSYPSYHKCTRSLTICHKLERQRFPTATHTNDLELSCMLYVCSCVGFDSSARTVYRKPKKIFRLNENSAKCQSSYISSDMNTSTHCGLAWARAQPKTCVCRIVRAWMYNLVAVDFALKPSDEVTFNHFKGTLKNTQSANFAIVSF